MQYGFSVEENKSKYHAKIVDFFKKEYPLFDLIQELSVQIDNTTLFCDIACKKPIKFIIEINPEHHYNFTPHFHKTIDNFKKAQARDKLKEKWAEMNGYLMIILTEEDFKNDAYRDKLKSIFS